MKLIVLLFLVGCATASIFDDLEDTAEEVYHDFMVGMESAPSLKEALGLHGDHAFADDYEITVKTSLGQRLKEALNNIIEKNKESFENGKLNKELLQNKLQEIKEQMKGLREELGDKARDLDQIREKSRDFLKNLLDKLVKKDGKRSIEDEELARLDFNLKDLFNRLKKSLLGKIDKEKLKAKIEELCGKGSEMADALEELILKKGDKYKQALLDLIDRFLGNKEKQFIYEQHSISEYWEKIKNYFKDLHIDLKDKYAKFGEWVKDVVKKGLDKSKTKLDNIKVIAQEFIDHTKGVSKDVAVEALEFLKPYKEDLGNLYDQVKETVKDILKKKD